MLRLSILQSVNGAILKLNTNENRFLTKCMNNLKTSNGIAETKDTSELQDTTIFSDIDGDVHKQIKDKEAALQKQQTDSKLSTQKSISIFGSETVKDSGLQYIKNNKDLKIPTVAYILSETMSPIVKAALEKWKKNMIDIYGEEHFKTRCKGLLDSSKLFYSYVQVMLSKKESEIPSSIKPIYSSIKPLLNDIQIFHGIETNVVHPILRYKSIIDCIASYRGYTYLIDWKKSAKRKTSLAATYDAPIQVAAYIGAINAFNKYSFKIDKGLIIVAYTSGEPASIHELKDDALEKAWGEWLNRLEQFHANCNKDSLNT
ncbi:mitochondrial genome maintenance exonuclease 1-like [Bombus pyrosoma]|uniref:mitochondrial genome maintenance exonuclease 1-like n=1 Tax=Bombus pyrosoma TaxID=396416 RepID=UPI001CB88DC3|nr:mitochondrial genome maintenance exonuclease 1-like [Bombus pyrosoma]